MSVPFQEEHSCGFCFQFYHLILWRAFFFIFSKKFSLFYSNGMAKKNKILYCISRQFMSRRFQICRFFFKSVDPSVLHSVSSISMFIPRSNSRISYKTMFQIFLFSFSVPGFLTTFLFQLFFWKIHKYLSIFCWIGNLKTYFIIMKVSVSPIQ